MVKPNSYQIVKELRRTGSTLGAGLTAYIKTAYYMKPYILSIAYLPGLAAYGFLHLTN